MKRFLTYIPLLALTLLACSCIKEQGAGTDAQEGTDIRIHFRMGIPSEGNPAGGQSRSLTGDDTGDEVVIDAVDVLAFVKGSDGKFRYTYSATNISKSGTESDVEVVATVKKYPSEQIFLIFCNSADEIAAAGIRPNEEIDDVLPSIRCGGDTAGEWPARINGSAIFKPFPMYAKTSAQVISDTNKELGDFPLVRMIARADITLKSGISNFVLVDARVYNRTVCGYVPYDFSGWNGAAKRVTSAGVPSGNAFAGRPDILASTVAYDADYGNDTRGEILRSIYLFESEGVAEADKLKGAAVIVGGKYNGSNDVTYYRIDIRTDATPAGYVSQDILRNHWYQIEIQNVTGVGALTPEDAYKGAKPIEFTVTVTDWGSDNKVPVSTLKEPEYFIIDHIYNTTEIHLHMVKYNQPFGYVWYTYANVPDNHDSEDVPPAGVQVSPPRKNSCASLYSKEPSNPWRLPTWDELLALRDYALNNGGVAIYNFDLGGNAFYWSATAQPGEPYDAYIAQIHTGGTGDWYKGGLIFGSGGHARCVRNKTGSGTTPPTPVPALSVDVNSLLASGNEETITVTSDTRWIAYIKPGTNSVTSSDALMIGQPLLSAFDRGDIGGYAGGGTAGTVTSVPLKVTTMNYWNPNTASGTFTIVFRDAETGLLIKEEDIFVQNCSLGVVSHTVPATIPQPGGSAYTVTFGGNVPGGFTFPVRVYDVAGGTALWTSAEGTAGARTIQIAAHPVWDSPRQLQVQYYYNGAWAAALTATQSGYYIAVDSHNISGSLTQPAANYTVTFSGYVPANFQMRVWDVTANAQISTSTAGVGARTASVTANATWATRSVRFEYSRNGVMTTIATVNQGGYYINISSAPQVANMGGTYTVIFSGIYPALTVTALAGGSAITSNTLPASSSSSGVALGIPNNNTGAARVLTLRVSNPSNQTFGWCTQQHSGPLADGYDYTITSRASNGSDDPNPYNPGWTLVPSNTLSQAQANTILRYLGHANTERFYWHSTNWDARGFYYSGGSKATWSGGNISTWITNYHNIDYVGGVAGAWGTVWYIWKRVI